MARIAGVDLPREKRIEVGLTDVYGIGQSTADEILAGTGGSGTHQDAACAELADDLVRNGGALQACLLYTSWSGRRETFPS